MINLYLTNGFTAGKLGIGIHFEGYIWSGGTTTSNANGVSIPRQAWNTAPTVAYDVPYKTLVADYSTNLYHWDTNAQAAYFSVTNQGANNQFISFDDTRACGSKISYARNNGLGGVILFELADDHPATGPDPLLEAVRQALATPGAMTIQSEGQSNLLSFTSAPLGSGRNSMGPQSRRAVLEFTLCDKRNRRRWIKAIHRSRRCRTTAPVLPRPDPAALISSRHLAARDAELIVELQFAPEFAAVNFPAQ